MSDTITLTELKLGPSERQRYQILLGVLRPPIKDSCKRETGSAGRDTLDLPALASSRLP